LVEQRTENPRVGGSIPSLAIDLGDMSYSSERSYYRIAYPPSARAELHVGDRACPVMEISERGFRFDPGEGDALAIGDAIEGVVHFACGLVFDIAGTIAREQSSTLVVLLGQPTLPFAAIMEEQRFLRQHYPMRFGPESPED
jgi:hypothetical protein